MGATYEETEAQQNDGYTPPENKGVNISGTKYFDSEGKPIKQENIENDESMKNDPVWKSAKTGESTRADLTDCDVKMDEELEKVIEECRKNLMAPEKIALRK